MDQAKECRASAAAATTTQIRDRFLRMAEAWELLARQRKTYLLLEATFADLCETTEEVGQHPRPKG